MPTILVTGAAGFVGTALVPVLHDHGFAVTVAAREQRPGPAGCRAHRVGEIGPATDWSEALAGVDAVVHLAARAHRGDETACGAEYWRVNAEGTVRLGLAAARAGVGRFVFLSSAKVHGERTSARPFGDEDAPAPQGAYAESKLAAERFLATLPREAGMEVVLLRPPLVYGPGVKANFRALLRLCASGIPLPLGEVENRRSFLHVRNLANAVATCLAAPRQPGCRTYLLRDDEDRSTKALVADLRQAMGLPPRLPRVPPRLLRAAGRLLGRGETVGRLLDSFQVDDSRFRRDHAWTPPVAVAEGLAETARWFRAMQRGERV